MMVPTGKTLPPQRINSMLNTFFGLLAEEPPEVADTFIKDRTDWATFTRLALIAARKNPAFEFILGYSNKEIKGKLVSSSTQAIATLARKAKSSFVAQVAESELSVTSFQVMFCISRGKTSEPPLLLTILINSFTSEAVRWSREISWCALALEWGYMRHRDDRPKSRLSDACKLCLLCLCLVPYVLKDDSGASPQSLRSRPERYAFALAL